MKSITVVETELIAVLAEGKTVREAAAILHISPHTAREYVKRAAAKLPGPLAPIPRLLIWYLYQRPVVLTTK